MNRLLLEEIRNAIDLRDLAIQSLQGKQSGKRVTARCPWHDDTNPSLSVAEQAFYCFGCQSGGDVFTWFMKGEGCSFVEAVERAAKLAGIEIDARFSASLRAAAQERKRLNQYCEDAQTALWSTPAALDYLRQRGLSDTTIVEFRLGYDTERRGIVIPMVNLQGDVLAYSLRFLDKDGPGKYWHRNTAAFKYAHHLYNERALWLYNSPAYIAEGPFDVMMLHQAGFPRSLGILGSKLSEMQVRRLTEHASTVVCVPDTGKEDDWRKLQANVRAIRTAAPDTEVLVAIPPGKDCGDCAEEQLQAAMQVKQSPEVVLLDLVMRGTRAEQYERAKAYVAQIVDPLVRDDVIRQLAERWDKPVQLVEQSLVNARARVTVAASTVGDAIEALRERTLAVAQSGLRFLMPGMRRFTETIQPGHVVAIAGHTNVGKSVVALNSIRQMNAENFLQVLFSLEQPQAEVAYRLMVMEAWANQCPVDYRRMKEILLEGGELYRTLKRLTEARLRNLRVLDSPMDAAEMAAALQAISTTAPLPIGVVWIDYFGLVKSRGTSRYERASDTALAMQNLAKQFNVIVCYPVQLSRPHKGEKPRPPRMDDIRDSGVIEETSDLIIGLHVEDTDDSGLRQTICAEVLKNRHGVLGAVKWLFRKDSLLIAELEEETMFD